MLGTGARSKPVSSVCGFTNDADQDHAFCRTHGPVQPAASSDDEDAPAIAGIFEDDTSFVQDGLRSAFPMSFGMALMTLWWTGCWLPTWLAVHCMNKGVPVGGQEKAVQDVQKVHAAMLRHENGSVPDGDSLKPPQVPETDANIGHDDPVEPASETACVA